MNLKMLALFLSATILLCGCSSPVSEPVMTTAATEITEASTAATEIIEVSTTAPTEPVSTTAPVIPTEPPGIGIPAGSHQLRFTSDETGDYLDYFLFIPEVAVQGMPLIVFLHGDGQVDNLDVLESYGAIESLRALYGENYPCIVISPCTRDYSWTKGSIPETLMAMIDYVAAECAIDPEHVIITGHSRGAMGVWYLISEYGDYFSAAVPVSCGTDYALNYENVSKVPVFAMAGNVGKYENIYLYEMEQIVAQIQEAGGTAILKCLEDCGHADTDTDAYTEDVINWMLEQ